MFTGGTSKGQLFRKSFAVKFWTDQYLSNILTCIFSRQNISLTLSLFAYIWMVHFCISDSFCCFVNIIFSIIKHLFMQTSNYMQLTKPVLLIECLAAKTVFWKNQDAVAKHTIFSTFLHLIVLIWDWNCILHVDFVV